MLGALSLVGTSSANRIFQLNAAGSLKPCDFCCLPREDEEHLVLGKCYPLFSCPKTVGEISQTLLARASTPQSSSQSKPSIPVSHPEGAKAKEYCARISPGPRAWTPRQLGQDGREQSDKTRFQVTPSAAVGVKFWGFVWV